MSDPTITIFSDDPAGYADWLDAHPDGWLLNIGDDGPIIHHASCDHTHPRSTRPTKDLTRNPKPCDLDPAVLLAWAAHHGLVVRIPCHRKQCVAHPALEPIVRAWNAR